MSVIDLLTRQPIAQAIGWALLQFLWQGAVLGVIAAVALSALRRSAPDIRYVVASIALAVMATLPIVTALQAGRNVAAPEERSIVPPATARATASPDPDRELTAAPDSADSANAPGVDAARPLNGRTGATWLALFAAAWLCGVLILSLRLATGWMWIQRLKSHRTTAVSARWQHTAQTLARQLHIRRPVRLLESASIAVPTVIGWLRPVVLMPASALAGLAPEQLQAILAHELAHIRRHDYLVNLLQTLVETLLFYHPAVWWLSRRIRAEREHCCDDLAVSLCGDPYTYARALADLEGLRAPSVPLVLAATGGSLLGRVRRLVIGPSHTGRGPGWLAGTVAVLVMRRRPRCHRQRVASVGASLANGRVPRHARHLRHAGTSNQFAARGARSGLCGAHRRARDRRQPSTDRAVHAVGAAAGHALGRHCRQGRRAP